MLPNVKWIAYNDAIMLYLLFSWEKSFIRYCIQLRIIENIKNCILGYRSVTCNEPKREGSETCAAEFSENDIHVNNSVNVC